MPNVCIQLSTTNSEQAGHKKLIEEKTYFQWWWNALHGDGSSSAESVGVDAPLAHVHGDGEGVPESDGSEQHLDADQKVLKQKIY